MARSSDARSHYEDQPTRAPMAPKGSERQSLTSDEKKMKRRSAAVNPDGVQAMTRAKRTRLEAMLRQRMASSSLQDQKAAARALDRLRAEANAEVEASQGLDYSERVVSSRLTPVQVANHHTAATDWLADEGTQVDGSEVQRAMHAQASRWFTRTSEAVRAEPDEFVIQAQGMARKLAGAHAPMQAVAADAFVRHAMFLNRSNLPARGKTAATFGDVADGYITLWNPTEGSETDKGAYWWEAFAPDANIDMDRPVASGYADSAEQAEQAAEDAASEHGASAPLASHSKKVAARRTAAQGEDLRGADLSGAYLTGASLTGADLGDANLSNANLRGADLGEANLGYADLGYANLREANLGYADLGYANLGYANLQDADLSNANLWNANLSNANLGGADLSNANLGSADLTGAELRDANLRGANCQGANFRGYANFRGADLRGADFTNADLQGAIADASTVLPDGWHLNENGVIERGDGLSQTSSRKTALEYADVDLGFGPQRITGPYVIENDRDQWYVTALVDGLNTTVFAAPTEPEVMAWVEAHPMFNPDGAEQLSFNLASTRKTASSEAYQAGLDIGTEYAGTDPSEFAYPSVLTETVMESGMDPNAMSADERNDWMRGFREGLGVTASRVTAGLDALDQAILEHAQSATGTIQVGDLIDGHKITEVGTHTIQYEKDGWNGSRQVPFVGPHGELYPSHQRATAESSRRTAADEHPWVDPEYERQVLKAVGELATGSPTASQVVAWLSNAFYLAGGYQDSFDRERAFSLAAQATGFDYNAIYDAWLDNPGFGDHWTYIQPKVWGGRSKTSSRRTAADDRVVFDDYFSGVLGDMDGEWAWQLTEGPDQSYGYAPTEAQARADMQAVVDNFWASHPIRTAVVESSDATVAQVQNYLPSNYKAKERGGQVVIEGFDSAGWTLEDYVIPRLQSGLIMARVASRKTAGGFWDPAAWTQVDDYTEQHDAGGGWVTTIEFVGPAHGGYKWAVTLRGDEVFSGYAPTPEEAKRAAEYGDFTEYVDDEDEYHHASRKVAVDGPGIIWSEDNGTGFWSTGYHSGWVGTVEARTNGYKWTSVVSGAVVKSGLEATLEQAKAAVEEWIAAENGGTTASAKTAGRRRTATRKVASDEPANIQLARKVLSEGFYAGGERLDAFSASAIVQVYDALSGENKAKFGAMSLERMVDVAFKLANKSASRRTTRTTRRP